MRCHKPPQEIHHLKQASKLRVDGEVSHPDPSPCMQQHDQCMQHADADESMHTAAMGAHHLSSAHLHLQLHHTAAALELTKVAMQSSSSRFFAQAKTQGPRHVGGAANRRRLQKSLGIDKRITQSTVLVTDCTPFHTV